jgi:hypothetical protein
MRALLGFGLGLLLVLPVSAQRGGVRGGFGGGQGLGRGRERQPPFRGSVFTGFPGSFGSRFGSGSWGGGFGYPFGWGYGYPYFDAGYGYGGYGYGNDWWAGDDPPAPSQGSILIQPMTLPQAQAAPPQPPAQPVIHEYKPSDLPEPARFQGPAPAFTIALKNGAQLQAAAVWVQDDRLHYIGSDRSRGAQPLEAIDRDATERANREKNLDLWLP